MKLILGEQIIASNSGGGIDLIMTNYQKVMLDNTKDYPSDFDATKPAWFVGMITDGIKGYYNGPILGDGMDNVHIGKYDAQFGIARWRYVSYNNITQGCVSIRLTGMLYYNGTPVYPE